MKQWNNPEICELGVEDTFENIDPIHSFGEHYCHRESEVHNGNCENGEGHTAISIGACIDHTTGTPKHPEYSCCCNGLNDGTMPPVS